MERNEQNGLETPREQVIYANLLILGVWLGLFVLFVTFGLYVLGVVAPHVPLEETPLRWGQAVDEYVKETRWPVGWSWVKMLHKGDILNYLGFVLLALLTVPGYLVLLRAYLRHDLCSGDPRAGRGRLRHTRRRRSLGRREA